jgi:phosphoribosylformylglycinamidine synthase
LTTRIGVVTFPGSLDDGDAARAVRHVGAEPVRLWHAEHALHQVDAVILPGGFSYGDYLRCGAIARFAPVMESIVGAAQAGLPVLGICNGFQILCEAHLLPGALTRNAHLHFRNRDQKLVVDATATAWTNAFTAGQQILIPIKSGEGRYVADERTLDELEANGRVVARYDQDSPNGSLRHIAGIANGAGNVVGIMPHPEHAIEALTGPSQDGLGFFTSVLKYLTGAVLPYPPASPEGVPSSPSSPEEVPTGSEPVSPEVASERPTRHDQPA